MFACDINSIGGVFHTLSNICDRDFLRKYVTVKILFSQESSIKYPYGYALLKRSQLSTALQLVLFKFGLSTTIKYITTNKLPDIFKNRGNRAIRFDQLIEYNVRNIFLQKSCRKWGKKTIIWGHSKWPVP